MDMQNNYVIAHLSDLHLGYSAGHKVNEEGVNLRECDGFDAFNEIISQIIEDGTVDVVLVAGDLFHTPTPDIRSMIVAQHGFRKLAKAGLKVYVISGNHDQSDIRSEIASSKIVDDSDNNIFSHAEPYVVHEIFPDIYLHLVSHHLFSEQAATFDKVKPYKNAFNIFSAHGTMRDPENDEVIHMEAPAPREIIIPSTMVDDEDWNYCLLGHIHERRYVGKTGKILYNGSSIRRGFSDGVTDLGRGWTKWTLHTDGTMTSEFKLIHQRPQIDYDVIDAKNFTADEISSIITDRLRDDLDNVKTSDDMPMLRQRIINISAAKKRSLDLAAIKDLISDKTLTWVMPTQTVEETELKAEKQCQLGKDDSLNGSISEKYSKWLGGNNEFSSLQDDIKKEVASNTKNYIEKGVESTLDNE